jgi:NADH-ubiquinone oxidoreductase chain 4
MLLSSLLLIPIIGIFLISSTASYEPSIAGAGHSSQTANNTYYKRIAFITSIINLAVSLVVYILFDFSTNQFQFVQEHYDLSFFDVYLGVDGLSIYFVLLTTIIMPIAIMSN